MLLFQMLKPFADLKNENKNIIKNRTNVYIHVQLSDNFERFLVIVLVPF